MIEAWKNDGISLGLRCLALARHEMKRGVKSAPFGQPNTSADVRRYLAPCLRDLDRDGVVEDHEKLGLTEGNWCAAFASWCMSESLLPGNVAPHLYRAGVVEIVDDAQARGLYHPLEEVKAGHWAPNVGDLVIWDRSNPNDPSTAWHRHVSRLVLLQGATMVTIGGNEQRRIVESQYAPKGLDASKLLGFVSYYQTPRVADYTHAEREANLELIAAFVREAREGRGLGLA